MLKSILTLIVLATPLVHADNAGTCIARSQGYDAYCESFEETACRMNNSECRWYPSLSTGGSCQPFDAGNPATAAYCESFDRDACRANSSTCYWL
jgi:hypothetical protein